MISEFFNLVFTVLLRPIILLFEVIFSLAYRKVQSPLFALTILSLTVNILVLPLYSRADELQAKTKIREAELRPMIDHIKKSFKGDERVMMLQTYYGEMKYNPLESLKSSVSLLLQIPFFIAAYTMISNLALLNGKSFGPISNLGKPDAMFSIGSFAVNVLPILMTSINILSSLIVTRGKRLKDKLQLFIMAGVFLVLLYNSPAGLVYYWTCNNIFSLLKSIVFSFVKPKKAKPEEKDRTKNAIFLINALFISCFIGLSIPSEYMVSAAADLLRIDHVVEPAKYLLYSLAIALGFFLFWGGVYYLLSLKRSRIIIAMETFSLFCVINYLAMPGSYGGMTRFVTYTGGLYIFDKSSIFICLLIIAAVGMIVYLVLRNKPQWLLMISVTLLAALVIFTGYNIAKIDRTVKSYDYLSEYNVQPQFTFSTEGKNVIVIMLDRAEGAFFPYIYNESDDVKAAFDGFTYYPNCISFGMLTNIASPALLGGYDYTPMAMNARESESLKDKHNEALLLMPLLFEENGYDVTVCDPPYANYMEFSDLSLYDDYPNIDAYLTYPGVTDYSDQMMEAWDIRMKRDLFMYGLMVALPEAVRMDIYDYGFYSDPNARYNEQYFQVTNGYSKALGVNSEYLDSEYIMQHLSDCTVLNDNTAGCFMFIDNNITHSPMLLEEPGLNVAFRVDNTEYDELHMDYIGFGDHSIEFNHTTTMTGFQVNWAAYERLAEWFEYLKECGVYDNTRIIIVADHGGAFDLGPGTVGDTADSTWGAFFTSWVNPILLVKDFDSTGFSVCDDFATNADVPYMATQELISDPVNPFTGNPIISARDYDEDILISYSEDHSPSENNGNTFIPGAWYRLNDTEDPFNAQSWEYAGEW